MRTHRPKIKVKPLDWFMRADTMDHAMEGYTRVPADFELIGRDGYYCRGNDVWFEVDGVGYRAYSENTQQLARQYFCYDLTVNDEAILPAREEQAMREVLKTTRTARVRKALNQRLRLHEQAVQLRKTGREARMWMIRHNDIV
jgi:hypothetical protein